MSDDMREKLGALNYMAHIGIIEEEDARIFRLLEEEKKEETKE